MLRRMAKYVYESLLPERMKTAVDIFRHLRMETIEGLTEKKVLIVAPHPDDETVGCGGTIRAYHRRGAHITCVFMTDGRHGNPDYDEAQLVAIRSSEAREAADILGIDRLIFLDHRDGELAVTPESVREMVQILEAVKPEAIFLPFIMESHPDHKAASLIGVAALKAITFNPLCYAWGLWTPLPYYNVTVDITPDFETKKQALEAYRSEIARFDLVGGTMAFSRYYYVRCGGVGRSGWTEVFLAQSAKELIRLGMVLK